MSAIHLKNGFINCEIDLQRGARLRSLKHGTRDVIVPLGQLDDEAMNEEARLGLVAMIACVHHTSLKELRWKGTGHPSMGNSDTDAVIDWGVGWQSPWEILEQSEDFVMLSLEHRAQKNWPWSFDASQTIQLKKTELLLSLSLTNQSSVPSPAGLGWGFSLPVDLLKEQLIIKAAQVYKLSHSVPMAASSIPVQSSQAYSAPESAYPLEAFKEGLGFGLWNGELSLNGPSHQLHLQSKLKTSQIKLSQDERSLLVKVLDLPVEVLQHARAAPMLAPGESISVQMSLMLS